MGHAQWQTTIGRGGGVRVCVRGGRPGAGGGLRMKNFKNSKKYTK